MENWLAEKETPQKNTLRFSIYTIVNQHPQWYGVENPKFSYQQGFFFEN
jgi:hypothetical protein